ncbi:uncharacterized protein LOC116263378 isoform X1 [Nymphaea colorata]|uniref:uncharacterized protein LOC116263378 isoform X1 n=1 Tax=Nymphaea colorata TaxID=210225 RepID=UPI00129DB48E|nr:uncharacterized protein LOC116263378 isoform X1 [Nymphaea colorata]
MISITPNSNFQSQRLFSQLVSAFQSPHSPRASSLRSGYGVRFLCSLRAATQQKANGGFDPELRSVLELATDGELSEIGSILYGRSYFSPLLKSIAYGDNVDDVMYEEAGEGREAIVELLESRFFFLAADARATLRGWRPSYRDVLLDLRKKLRIPCSSRLTTGDLEAEIFLHVLQEFSSEEMPRFSFSRENTRFSDCYAYTDGPVGANQWKIDAFDVLKVGAKELKLIFLKGGGMLTLTKIYQLLRRSLSGKLLLEAANYQIKHEAIKKGGQLAAVSLESRVALLAAKKLFHCDDIGFGFSSITIFWPTKYDDVNRTIVMGDISGRYCNPNDRNRLCQDTACGLCICTDPPNPYLRMDNSNQAMKHKSDTVRRLANALPRKVGLDFIVKISYRVEFLVISTWKQFLKEHCFLPCFFSCEGDLV